MQTMNATNSEFSLFGPVLLGALFLLMVNCYLSEIPKGGLYDFCDDNSECANGFLCGPQPSSPDVSHPILPYCVPPCESELCLVNYSCYLNVCYQYCSTDAGCESSFYCSYRVGCVPVGDEETR